MKDQDIFEGIDEMSIAELESEIERLTKRKNQLNALCAMAAMQRGDAERSHEAAIGRWVFRGADNAEEVMLEATDAKIHEAKVRYNQLNKERNMVIMRIGGCHGRLSVLTHRRRRALSNSLNLLDE